MKKSQINSILVNQANRRKKILIYSSCATILFILSMFFLFLYISNNKSYTVSYKENSKVDYKVFLKDNPYFNNNYLGTNNQYLEKLIDYVDADFNYDISMEEKNIDYKYSYRIDAEVEVKSKSSKNPIYKFTDNLLPQVEKEYNSNNNVSINQNIKIDYNHYNDLIKEFVSVYTLDDIESVLTVKMYVNVIGTCEEFETDSNNETVLSLVIPLTTKTVDINISDDIINKPENVIVCKKSNNVVFVFLISFLLLLCSVILLLINLIKYIINTRTPEDVYHKELAKILNNYGTYIQEVTNTIDLSEYEVWKIKTFDDMLEISDKVSQPILMVQNSKNTGVYFIIPNVDKRLYYYGFKVSEIKKKMKDNNIKEIKRGEVDE